VARSERACDVFESSPPDCWGRSLNPPGRTVDLLLEVARPGGDRYTTHLVVGFSTPERRTRVATVGTRLPVRVNPDQPGKIAIDTIALLGR
jgi:hypothetical protein